MTKTEAKCWLGEYQGQDFMDSCYPVTIIADRYTGAYLGAKFTAWPLYEVNVPGGSSDGDTECADFWGYYNKPVGKGKDPNSAFQDLIDKMKILASN